MPKRLIQRWLPDPATLKEHKHLRLFGKLLLDANLWHLNRRSAAGAFAVGLFMAWVPLPCQLLGQSSQHIEIEFTWAWLVSVFETVAPPLLLGSLVLALLSSLIGYALIRTCWRISTVRQWQKRKVARAC